MMSKKHFEAIAAILSKVIDYKTRMWLISEFRTFLQQENPNFSAELFWNRIAELHNAKQEVKEVVAGAQ